MRLSLHALAWQTLCEELERLLGGLLYLYCVKIQGILFLFNVFFFLYKSTRVSFFGSFWDNGSVHCYKT